MKTDNGLNLFFFMVGSYATMLITAYYMSGKEAQGWYKGLKKPSWQPPPWVFGLVWFVLYSIIGYVGWRGHSAIKNKDVKGIFIVLFILLLGLSVGWAVAFYSNQDIKAGFWIIIAFLIVAVLMAVVVYPSDHISMYLLLPLIVWLAFAAALNGEIVKLNPGI